MAKITDIDINKKAREVFQVADEKSEGNRYARNLILTEALRYDNPKSLQMAKVMLANFGFRIEVMLFRSKCFGINLPIPLNWRWIVYSIKEQGLIDSFKNRFIPPVKK